MLAPSPQGIRQRHKTARAVDPSVLTVEILVAGKIHFASCRLRTFGFNAGCLLFLQLGEELLSVTPDLDSCLGTNVLCTQNHDLSISQPQGHSGGHKVGV